ncbi:Importin-13 [Rhodotorula toruloides]|nr:Importin-13 [Rhodotorula toruloides]
MSRLAALIPPKLASPSAIGAPSSAARMAKVVEFYSALPKGPAPKKRVGASPLARYKARYFDGPNASAAPFLHVIGGLFLLGYTIDYNMHLKHHKNERLLATRCVSGTDRIVGRGCGIGKAGDAKWRFSVCSSARAMEADISQVIQAIQALYNPSTAPSLQSTLQHSLTQLQHSPQAWSLVGPLIAHEDPAVRFFAASTLEEKITRGWGEVEHVPEVGSLRGGDGELSAPAKELKDSVLAWLAKSAVGAFPPASAAAQPVQGEKPVLRKLTAAATALSLRLQDRWKDWLLEVVMRVAASGARREATLEVLSTAIEQVARAELVGSKRMAYMSSLSSTIPHLVSTLSSSLSPPSSPAEINSAFSCFVSYLNAGQLSSSELTTLYPLFLPHLSNPATVVAACGAIEELVERSSGLSETGGSGLTRFVNRQRTTELINGWVTSPFVQHIFAQAISDAREGSEPDEEALAVFKLVASLADHFITTFLFDPPPASSITDPSAVLSLTHPAIHTLLSLLIALSSFPGHTSESYLVNELPCSAWMNLQELGADGEGMVSGEGEGREGRYGKEKDWEVYRGVFVALAEGLRGRATRPSEEEVKVWPKDVREAFRQYRSTTLAETAQNAYFVLRDDMISGLVQLAAQQVSQPPAPGQDSYEDLEASLFILFSIGEVVPLSPSLADLDPAAPPSRLNQNLSLLFGPSILGRLPSQSGSYPSLRSTALRLVGAYSAWFSSNPDACLQAVSFVVSGLQEPDLVPGAARALKGLCDANRKVLVGHVASFVQVLGNLEGRIDDAELAKVLESVASVVQALPETQIVEPLLTLTNPIIGKLSSAAEGNASAPKEDPREVCVQQLSYLSALAKGLADPEDDLVDLDASFEETTSTRDAALRILRDPRVVDMRRRLAQAIEAAARRWPSDTEVVTALSDYIRHSTSDSVPSPLALDSLDLLNFCSAALQSAPSSVWLGIEGQLLARLARDRTDAEMSDDQLAKVGQPIEGALRVVLGTHGEVAAMAENPDVVAAFLGLCCQVVRLYPRIFSVLPAHYLDAVLAFAERGLAMQEQFSLKATIELLLSSVQQTKMASSSSTAFRSALIPRVPSLLRALMTGIGGNVPRSHLTQLSELLHACLLRLAEQARPTLHDLLEEPGFPSERATPEAKSRFGRAILSARTGKQVRQAVSDFALLCRGLDGSAYGAATHLY